MSTSRRDPSRRALRLKGCDYAQPGAYFITIVTERRICFFGEVINGTVRLNEAGQMIQSEWESLPGHFAGVVLDTFVVMPNHIHGIVVLNSHGGARAVDPGGQIIGESLDGPNTAAFPSLAGVIGAFKSATTVLYARGVKQRHWLRFRRRLWQRNYYEHIVRGEESLQRIRQYIAENPLQWELDRENPDVAKAGLTVRRPSRGEPWRF